MITILITSAVLSTLAILHIYLFQKEYSPPDIPTLSKLNAFIIFTIASLLSYQSYININIDIIPIKIYIILLITLVHLILVLQPMKYIDQLIQNIVVTAIIGILVYSKDTYNIPKLESIPSLFTVLLIISTILFLKFYDKKTNIIYLITVNLIFFIFLITQHLYTLALYQFTVILLTTAFTIIHKNQINKRVITYLCISYFIFYNQLLIQIFAQENYYLYFITLQIPLVLIYRLMLQDTIIDINYHHSIYSVLLITLLAITHIQNTPYNLAHSTILNNWIDISTSNSYITPTTSWTITLLHLITYLFIIKIIQIYKRESLYR